MDTAVIVALISTFGVITASVIQSFRKESREASRQNRNDHQMVQQSLSLIFRKITRIDDKIEAHLDQHREGSDGRTIRSDKKLND
jgi:hypothetical protein